ncbi:transmembrane protein 100 [Conger conger]|uniref:transmembrane protein 100 n=1 Tax=Conger conger TaxID=82655 RepID=UPI002A599991|nr:transmembrane protein 100 [Conger conger]
MGCTAGSLTCPSQPGAPGSQPGPGQDPAPKVPEALTSLERLSQATGGMEKSWYRCIFPFGLIALVIGVAGTGVAFTFNNLPLTKAVSVVLLGAGLGLVMMAAACWTVHRQKRRKRKEGAPPPPGPEQETGAHARFVTRLPVVSLRSCRGEDVRP